MLLLHLVNRLLAALLSLALIALAVVVAVEVALWFVGEPSWVAPWRDWAAVLTEVRADDPGLVATAAVLLVLGLLLLAFELAPRRPDALEAAPLLSGVATTVTRKGVASAATTAARDVSGVVGARSSVRRTRVEVRAATRSRDERGPLQAGVCSSVERALDELQLTRRPKVRVSVAEES